MIFALLAVLLSGPFGPDVQAAPRRAQVPAAAPSPTVAPLVPVAEELPVPEPLELPDLTLDKDGGITLTLENSIRLGIEGATTVLRQQNIVLSNGADLLEGYGRFLPNLTAQGNYGYNTGTSYLTSATPTTVTGRGWNAGYAVSTDLNLFNGLADFANLRSTMLKKESADLTLYRAKQQIALDVCQSFLQVILDNKIVDIARKNLQASQARENLLTEQTRVGIRNLSDLFRQQAQTSSDVSFLLTSENKGRADQILFLRRLRADIAKKYHFIEPDLSDEKVSDKYKDETVLMNGALARRVDLKASNELSDAGHWDVRTNFAGYLPKLDLAAGVVSAGDYILDQSVNGASVTPPVQSNLSYQLGTQLDYSVTLKLSWSIFDRFLTNRNVQHARATSNDLDVDAQDRRNQVQGDVRRAYGDYQTAVQQLVASKKGLEAAQKAYEVMEGRYEVGAANFVDLITVQDALVQAESARAQALIDFQLQRRSIEYAIGEIKIDY